MFQVDKSGAGVIESGSSLKKRREDMDDFTVYDMNAAADMRSASSRPQYDYRLGTDQNDAIQTHRHTLDVPSGYEYGSGDGHSYHLLGSDGRNWSGYRATNLDLPVTGHS